MKTINPDEPTKNTVNDIHTTLNGTNVREIVRPSSLEQLCSAVVNARREGASIAVSGGRHAMGGQQFGEDSVLIDTVSLKEILSFDMEAGIVEAEAGILWPELLAHLEELQADRPQPWGVRQMQTGASRLSLGGALSANVHGRGLAMKPFIDDVESFVLVNAEGTPVRCSRDEHRELFGLAIGGYGLFGVIYSVRLRLSPRMKMERVVEIADVEGIIDRFEERIAEGFLYGDFQFSPDESSEGYMTTGIFACYRPVDIGTPFPKGHRELSEENWMDLLYLAHADRTLGFRKYSEFYLGTQGQLYWSDTHQLGVYLDDYHVELDRRLGTPHRETEIITEIYVPRERLTDFLREIRDDFRTHNVRLIYGTVRLIQQDDESFLAWAREPYACIIFNLCTSHTPEGLRHSADAFRGLIDAAIPRGGSYYLTYHRFARRDQIEACYPQFADFLRRKREYDPDDLFQSNWYRHYAAMFADALAEQS